MNMCFLLSRVLHAIMHSQFSEKTWFICQTCIKLNEHRSTCELSGISVYYSSLPVNTTQPKGDVTNYIASPYCN